MISEETMELFKVKNECIDMKTEIISMQVSIGGLYVRGKISLEEHRFMMDKLNECINCFDSIRDRYSEKLAKSFE